MAKNGRMKRTAAQGWTAQSLEDVERAVGQIGDLTRELARVEANMNDEIAGVKEQFEREAEPHRGRIQELTEGVQRWAEANRADLTKNERTKTVSIKAGFIGWRLRPPSVAIKGWDKVLDRLRELRLERFIRVSHEADKEAMLKEPAVAKGVEGITIKQGEDFFIEPAGLALKK